MNKLCLWFIFLLFFLNLNYGFCQDITVSFIDKTNPDNVKIELNQTLFLQAIKLKNTNDKMTVVIPYYIKNNIKYPYFSFIDIKFKAYVMNSIKFNTIDGTPPNTVRYKISRIRPAINSKNGILALTFVTFSDLMEIECFIVKDKKNFKVLWPGMEYGQSRVPFFSIKDPALKGRIENDILNRYKIEIIKNHDNNRAETKS